MNVAALVKSRLLARFAAFRAATVRESVPELCNHPRLLLGALYYYFFKPCYRATVFRAAAVRESVPELCNHPGLLLGALWSRPSACTDAAGGSLPLFAALLLFTLPAAAQFLPDRIGQNHLASKAPITLADPAVWTEYGLQDSAEGTYEGADGHYTLALFRLQDPTSALAAFLWQRPADAKPSPLSRLAAEAPGSITVASGNYLVIWRGHRPPEQEMNALFLTVPKYQGGNLPSLIAYMPASGLRPNSERYILGPASLAKFYPEIPPATAAFHLGAEAEVAAFGKDGGVKLAIFNFPTPEAARRQLQEFEKLPGVVAKRTLPLVAVTVYPSDLNEAETVLSHVRYEATITQPQKPPTRKDNPGNLLLNIVWLIGILIVFCVLSGLAFGGLRQLFRRMGPSDDGEAMVSLHLFDR